MHVPCVLNTWWPVRCIDAGFTAAQGRVANCVETEQLIELSSPKGTVLSSFVQLRGSIPLMWSQIPNIKYKPTTRIAPPDTYARAFDRHVTDLLDIYKVHRRLLRSPNSRLAPDLAAEMTGQPAGVLPTAVHKRVNPLCRMSTPST